MYKYGMRLRPFGIGCQPEGNKEYIELEKSKYGYHGILVYEEPLTKTQIEGFELTPLNHGKNFDSLEQETLEADKVIVELKKQLNEAIVNKMFAVVKFQIFQAPNEVFKLGAITKDLVEKDNKGIFKDLENRLENETNIILEYVFDKPSDMYLVYAKID